MKKMFLIATAFMVSATMAMSQEMETELPIEPAREQVETPEAALHGQTVSEVARETRSGEIISEQARTKGESKRAERMERRDQRRQDRIERHERGGRPENLRPQRPERPTRPENPGRPANPGRP